MTNEIVCESCQPKWGTFEVIIGMFPNRLLKENSWLSFCQ